MIKYVRLALYPLLLLLVISCSKKSYDGEKRIIVLGMDGLEPSLIQKFIEKNKLPNFKKLIKSGDFKKLRTSHPPQSPVAWSNFITGNNPGKHGIFDFIHRNPKTYQPYLSTSINHEGRYHIKIGRYRIPLKPPFIENSRKSRAFWTYLGENKIPAWVIKIPSNFPPEGKLTSSISGMGTPDIRGTNGNFSLYSTSIEEKSFEVDGGMIYPVSIINNRITNYLYGPHHPWLSYKKVLKKKFTATISRDAEKIKLTIEDKVIFLNQGEWSSWIPVSFDILPPFYSLNAIVRFYLMEITPEFKLYASPLNIDPAEPSMPISSPPHFSREIYRNTGYFYTQGLPEESKALTSGIFSRKDYLLQNCLVWKERKELFKWTYNEFRNGILFFYFTTPDLNQHLFWAEMDSTHPGHSNVSTDSFKNVIQKTYIRMDSIIGMLHEDPDSALIIILSDHGFAPFYRAFNVNTWLMKNGYLSLKKESMQSRQVELSKIDWNNTLAYSLGFNSIYINLRDREYRGMVEEKDKDSLINIISSHLESTVDPKYDRKPVLKAYPGDSIYKGENTESAPDICIGYRRGYRTSWKSAMGIINDSVFTDNLGHWSGTHLIAPEEVPGILITNRKISREKPELKDIPATILKVFNINTEMEGRDIFSKN